MIRKCWLPDPDDRITPQAIMKEMNYILYKNFNAEKFPPYVYIDEATVNNVKTGIESVVRLYLPGAIFFFF